MMTHAGPANESVVERLVGAIHRGRIPPHHRPFRITWTIPLSARRSSTRGMPRVRGKGFNALKLSLSQPELIGRWQVLLLRLNHDVASFEFAKVCYAGKPDTERDRLQSR